MIDFHTHQQAVSTSVERVFNITLPRDAHLPLPSGPLSVGLHPWFVSEKNWRNEFEQVQNLAQLPNIVMIGECGFDKLVLDRLPILVQQHIVDAHLALAAEVQKPMVFHCVRAYSELISTIKKRKPSVGMMIHGYNNKYTTAEQLLDLGCYLSFGAALLNPNSNAAQTLKQTPINKICLETDDTDLPIERIFAAASELLQLPIPQLEAQITLNFNTLLSNG